MRYAAIDVGSNAVRLLIADIIESPGSISFKKHTFIRVPLRLGDDAFLDHKLSEKKVTDLVKTMHAFKNLMDVYKVTDYIACATSAMREATNGREVIAQVKQQAGLNLEIIHGQKEAGMIYTGNKANSMDKLKNYLYVDVGGGSTELSLFSNGEMQASRSFNIGTIRMLDNQDTEESWNEMKGFIKELSRQFKNIYGVGTGGNINKLYRLADEKEKAPLTYQKLKALYSYLSSFSLKDRINVLGLKQDRADVIIPACEIYLTVMKCASVKFMFVPTAGLVDGIIQTLIKKNLGRGDDLIRKNQ